WRSFQYGVDEMTAVDFARKGTGTRKVRSAAPELPCHDVGGIAIDADDIQEDVVEVFIRGQKRGVRGLQLRKQPADNTNGILQRRCGENRRADLCCACSPIDLFQPGNIKVRPYNSADTPVVKLLDIDSHCMVPRGLHTAYYYM